MDHKTGGDAGGIDRVAGSAGAALGFGRREQCECVVVELNGCRGGEDSNRFAQHTTVAPESTAVSDGPEDGGASGAGIDTTEDYVAGILFGPVAVSDRRYFDGIV